MHKNDKSYIKQILEEKSHKTVAVWPPTPHLKDHPNRWTRYAGHRCRSKDEPISNVLPWTPSHRCTSVGQPVRTYLQLLCTDTECSLEDLPEAMEDRDGWRERVREIHASSITWWWWYIWVSELRALTKKRIMLLNRYWLYE